MFEKSEKIDYSKLKECKTLNDFDQHFTIKLFGYDTLQDYFRDASSISYIQCVKIPVLIIHALDDPFTSESIFKDKQRIEESNCIVALFNSGGHLGFQHGIQFWKNKRWSNHVTKEFIITMRSLKKENSF